MATAATPKAITTTTPNSLLLKSKSPTSTNTIPFLRRNKRHTSITCTMTTASPVGAIAAAAPGDGSDGRVYNFGAGPATLPLPVLVKVQAELLNFRGTGMSIAEISHRSKAFDAVIKKAEADLRTLLSIPDNYAVVFFQGGATSQFSALPLNLTGEEDAVADYVVTGSWSDKAFKEAKKFCDPKLTWSGKDQKYTTIPPFDSIEQNQNAKYLHICANETIHGVEFKEYPVPKNKNGILVADMSSNFCSKPVNVSKFGVIYAGAQKNVAPAGVTIVIVRKDLMGSAQPKTPVMYDYKTQAENNSVYNTPPCFAIYVAGLVFEHLLELGGLEEVERMNKHKAGVLYNAIDESDGYYICPVEKSVRSLMNVPFTMGKGPEFEKKFIAEATEQGMVELKGHRSVGGIRASIYNAMALAGVEKLVAFMKEFRARNP